MLYFILPFTTIIAIRFITLLLIIHALSSQDPEHLLQLYHCGPVIFGHLVTVVRLKQVDRVSRKQRANLVLVVELTSISYRAIVLDLHSDTAILRSRLVDRLFVQLN